MQDQNLGVSVVSLIMFVFGLMVMLNLWFLTNATKQLRIVKKNVMNLAQHLKDIDAGLIAVAESFRESSEKLADCMADLTREPDEGGDESGGNQDGEDIEAEPDPNVNDTAAAPPSAYIAPVDLAQLTKAPSESWGEPFPFQKVAHRTINPDTLWLYSNPIEDGVLSSSCAKPGCCNKPTHYLKLLVDQDPTDLDTPDATILVGVALCLEHLIVPIDQVVQRCANELASIGIFAIGRDAVALQPGIIGDEDWENWLALRAQAEGGGRA
jgi:hypothetical protein